MGPRVLPAGGQRSVPALWQHSKQAQTLPKSEVSVSGRVSTSCSKLLSNSHVLHILEVSTLGYNVPKVSEIRRDSSLRKRVYLWGQRQAAHLRDYPEMLDSTKPATRFEHKTHIFCTRFPLPVFSVCSPHLADTSVCQSTLIHLRFCSTLRYQAESFFPPSFNLVSLSLRNVLFQMS